VLAGSVEHGDNLDNKGRMTAGRGILYQGMPRGDAQVPHARIPAWANLPSSLKMTDPIPV
jgi:hypothetical protein